MPLLKQITSKCQIKRMFRIGGATLVAQDHVHSF